jgi:4,5:9,10-diseco-3-hydroxy-5,9,17-trioxoandrosta-1(10),2-diene-4-oate hydrolase
MQARAPRENVVVIHGTRLRYLDVGAGPPLLLIHGLGQSSTAWLRVIDGLAAAGCRVIAPDLPGHGGSEVPTDAPFDPQYIALVCGQFFEALGLETFDAVGHSAGALALLLDALDSPQRYRKLVLVDPAGFTPAPDNLLGTAAASLARLLVSIPRNRALTRALYATAFYDSYAVDEETVDELVLRRSNPKAKRAARLAFSSFFEYCRRLEPLHARLAGFATPTLGIWGSDDRLFRVSDASVAQRVLPHARIERFERCGHCPQIEHPELFTRVVLEFLAAK